MRMLCRSVVLSLLVPAALQAQRLGRPAQRMPELAPEVQLALDDLAPRFAGEIASIQGWFRDQPVSYYDFGAVVRPVVVGRVLWPIHGFDAQGNPVAIRGQRPIFSAIPGLPAYSGLWTLSYVVTADHAGPNQLRDMDAVQALVNRRRATIIPTQLTLNLPVVARGTRLAGDTSSGAIGWYAGREIQYFDFGQASAAPAPMWRFARGQDLDGNPIALEGQNSVVDSVPAAAPYPDLWDISFVEVDSTYAPNSLRSAAALRAANVAIGAIGAQRTIRNLPITVVDGAPARRARSPLTIFADTRSPFPPAPTRSP